MKRKRTLQALILLLLTASNGAELFPDSLEFGHVRARSRGWSPETVVQTPSDSVARDAPEAIEEATSFEPEDAAEELEFSYDEVTVDGLELETREAVEVSSALPTTRQASRTVAQGVKTRPNSLFLLGRKEDQPDPRKGYLALGPPRPLRFSDMDSVNARPPAPALPEFSFTSSEYPPYLIERALPEEEANDLAALSEIVVELEPHEVVSGKIDTRALHQEERVEHFELDEQRSTILRPEEVLIYFETDTRSGSTGAMVPFSPATPSAAPAVKSSATLKKE